MKIRYLRLITKTMPEHYQGNTATKYLACVRACVKARV